MNNTFDFSYFVPTPDTTANCALSRWNDGLMGLSDFLKAYMSSRQSLEFGFSRNLNIKELINLNNNITGTLESPEYVIDYKKFGEIKACVCGFEIPIIDLNTPFLKKVFVRDTTTNEIIEYTPPYDDYIIHVYNKNSNLSFQERIDNTLLSLSSLKNDIQNENLIPNNKLKCIFKKDKTTGNYKTRQQIINEINDAIYFITNMNLMEKSRLFGFKSKKDLYEQYKNNTNYSDFEIDYFSSEPPKNNNIILSFFLNINDFYRDNFQNKYLTPNGIEFEYAYSKEYSYIANKKSNILLFFEFSFTEKESITPFVSHDGTYIPISEQKIKIRYSLEDSVNTNVEGDSEIFKSYWDEDEECPVYFDIENNAKVMTLENNIDGMGGRDYTIWSSPIQKTENGYKFECCMPLAFYNAESDSYSNEYYATKLHEGIEIGEVIYRVPVVKRIRQNIEEAIVNTHLTKCLNDLVPATNENAEENNTIILGGVVVDDFTEGLYPIAEQQKIASETEYGEVKIIKANEDVLNLMYNYSETGELSYQDMIMPETGRAIDMITLFDTLKSISGGTKITNHTFVVNGINEDIQVTLNSYSTIYAKNALNITTEDTISMSSYDGEGISSIIVDNDSIKLRLNETSSFDLLGNGKAKIISTNLYANDITYDHGTSNEKIYKRFVTTTSYGVSNNGIIDYNHDDGTNSNVYFELLTIKEALGEDSSSAKICIKYYNTNNSDWSISSLTFDKSNINQVAVGREECCALCCSDSFGSCDLGRTDSKWRDIFCERVLCDNILCDNTIILKSTLDISGQSNNGMNILINNTGADAKTCLAFKYSLSNSNQTVDNRIELITSNTTYTNPNREIINVQNVNGISINYNNIQKINQNKNFDIGSLDNKFDSVYCNNINKNSTNSDILNIESKTKLNKSVEFFDSTPEPILKILVDDSNENNGVYFYKDILPATNTIVNIGNNSRKIEEIYWKDPVSLRDWETWTNLGQTITLIGVGSIGLIGIGNNGSTDIERVRGESLKNDQNPVFCCSVTKKTETITIDNKSINLEYYDMASLYKPDSEFYLLEERISIPASGIAMNKIITALVVRKS